MCGIAGLWSISLDQESVLRAMLSDLEHRGPEGAGVLLRGPFALGHTHLAFTDLSPEAAQPMATAETALSFNGEIFNHVELARARSLSLRTTSDAEVLLHLLRSHGLAALPELNGFFAIAFADFSKGKLWLIRDRFGVKPLYFASSPGLFGFASEIRPLRRLGPFLPDEPTVRHNLIGNWTQGAGTGVQNIHRVLPGCYVEFDLATGSTHAGRWFSLADLRDDDLRRDLHDCPTETLAERTRAILREAVARRSGGAAPLAVLCSGGLDSGIVTALMHETRPAITAFSADYPETPEWSEYPWARRLCRHLGCELRPVKLSGARWRSLFAKTAVHFEYPLWHESSVAIAAIAEDLQRAGFKGVLGGEGADELFGGYDYKYYPQRTAYAAWAACPPTLSTADPQELVHDPILESLYGAYAPHPADRAYREEVAAMAVAAASELGTPAEALDAILATELLLFLTIVLCRLDRSLMQCGIEGREPYLDLELARFAFNLPLRVKTCPRTKEILRAAAVPWIPAPLLERKKRGFSVDPEIFLRGFLNPRFLAEAALRDHLKIDRQQWRKAVADLRGRSLLRVAGAEIWYRSLFLGEAEASIEELVWSQSPA